METGVQGRCAGLFAGMALLVGCVADTGIDNAEVSQSRLGLGAACQWAVDCDAGLVCGASGTCEDPPASYCPEWQPWTTPATPPDLSVPDAERVAYRSELRAAVIGASPDTAASSPLGTLLQFEAEALQGIANEASSSAGLARLKSLYSTVHARKVKARALGQAIEPLLSTIGAGCSADIQAFLGGSLPASSFPAGCLALLSPDRSDRANDGSLMELLHRALAIDDQETDVVRATLLQIGYPKALAGGPTSALNQAAALFASEYDRSSAQGPGAPSPGSQLECSQFVRLRELPGAIAAYGGLVSQALSHVANALPITDARPKKLGVQSFVTVGDAAQASTDWDLQWGRNRFSDMVNAAVDAIDAHRTALYDRLLLTRDFDLNSQDKMFELAMLAEATGVTRSALAAGNDRLTRAQLDLFAEAMQQQETTFYRAASAVCFLGGASGALTLHFAPLVVASLTGPQALAFAAVAGVTAVACIAVAAMQLEQAWERWQLYRTSLALQLAGSTYAFGDAATTGMVRTTATWETAFAFIAAVGALSSTYAAVGWIRRWQAVSGFRLFQAPASAPMPAPGAEVPDLPASGRVRIYYVLDGEGRLGWMKTGTDTHKTLGTYISLVEDEALWSTQISLAHGQIGGAGATVYAVEVDAATLRAATIDLRNALGYYVLRPSGAAPAQILFWMESSGTPIAGFGLVNGVVLPIQP